MTALGRPLGYLICSIIALIGDPTSQHFSNGFRGQPRSAGVPKHLLAVVTITTDPASRAYGSGAARGCFGLVVQTLHDRRIKDFEFLSLMSVNPGFGSQIP